MEECYAKYCKTRFPLPKESQVKALEKKLGVPLPKAYREFLLEFNGGFFRDPDIKTQDSACPEDSLAQLNGIGASLPCADIGSPANLSLFEDNTPAKILPIGYTLMGNLLLLDLVGKTAGRVLLKVAFSKKVFVVADSISELLEGLSDSTS